ncbi:MAG TPA: helix-hairpin-helix domain-containing protein [Spirochaetota bacterium]
MNKIKTDLQEIPGIGPAIEKSFLTIGINSISDLRGKDPDKLYNQLEKKLNSHVDRCLLYAYRCAVYYASHKKHDPEKLRWWWWKDS